MNMPPPKDRQARRSYGSINQPFREGPILRPHGPFDIKKSVIETRMMKGMRTNRKASAEGKAEGDGRYAEGQNLETNQIPPT